MKLSYNRLSIYTSGNNLKILWIIPTDSPSDSTKIMSIFMKFKKSDRNKSKNSKRNMKKIAPANLDIAQSTPL